MATTNGIIPGYHGIMDLDIRNIEPTHIKQAIDQHYNDIKIYNAEQYKLKPEHRYENTVMRINKLRKYEYYFLKKRAQEKKDFLATEDKRRIEAYKKRNHIIDNINII